MVILYHHTVVQTEPMVEPASTTDGILLQTSQSRQCLPRIADSGTVLTHRFHCAGCSSSNAAQVLYHVKYHSLSGQQSRDRPLHFGDHIRSEERRVRKRA